MDYITTEYEAEAIAGRRQGIVTISDRHGVSFSIPVTILSYDWARADPGKAAADPAWAHGGIAQGPVYDVALAAYSIKRGYGSHWATFEECGGEG